MKVHHLNCGTMRPAGGRLISGTGHPFRTATLIAHCLLIEASDSLVLIDTGFGLGCLENPQATLGRQLLLASRPVLRAEETAVRQLAALGHSPKDVRHIVLTHLDADHAGGLADFPDATVHVHAPEYRAAMDPASRTEKSRYRPALWAHTPEWETYGVTSGERWFGFEAVRELDGLPDDIVLVPLAGHTRGHTAVAIRTGDRWLLHAGDAIFYRGEVDPVRPHCPPGLRLFQTIVQEDGSARHANQGRLRELAKDHGAEVDIISAHDPAQLPVA